MHAHSYTNCTHSSTRKCTRKHVPPPPLLQRFSPRDAFHVEVPGLGEMARFGEEREQEPAEAIVHVEANAFVLY
jgi:hypothetical protein